MISCFSLAARREAVSISNPRQLYTPTTLFYQQLLLGDEAQDQPYELPSLFQRDRAPESNQLTTFISPQNEKPTPSPLPTPSTPQTTTTTITTTTTTSAAVSDDKVTDSVPVNRASEEVAEEELDDDYEELVNPAYDVPRRLLPPREAYCRTASPTTLIGPST